MTSRTRLYVKNRCMTSATTRVHSQQSENRSAALLCLLTARAPPPWIRKGAMTDPQDRRALQDAPHPKPLPAEPVRIPVSPAPYALSTDARHHHRSTHAGDARTAHGPSWKKRESRSEPAFLGTGRSPPNRIPDVRPGNALRIMLRAPTVHSICRSLPHGREPCALPGSVAAHSSVSTRHCPRSSRTSTGLHPQFEKTLSRLLHRNMRRFLPVSHFGALLVDHGQRVRNNTPLSSEIGQPLSWRIQVTCGILCSPEEILSVSA